RLHIHRARLSISLGFFDHIGRHIATAVNACYRRSRRGKRVDEGHSPHPPSTAATAGTPGPPRFTIITHRAPVVTLRVDKGLRCEIVMGFYAGHRSQALARQV